MREWNGKPVLTKAERTCYCRGCDTKMSKGADMVFTHSWRNRGQNIMFCIDCARYISELIGIFDASKT